MENGTALPKYMTGTVSGLQYQVLLHQVSPLGEPLSFQCCNQLTVIVLYFGLVGIL